MYSWAICIYLYLGVSKFVKRKGKTTEVFNNQCALCMITHDLYFFSFQPQNCWVLLNGPLFSEQTIELIPYS